MNDKKCCENCYHSRAHTRPSQVPCPRKKVEICNHWKRNPNVWLDILPEEEGWYWWRLNDSDNRYKECICLFKNSSGRMMCVDPDADVLAEDMKCQWQGPIVPHNEKS